MLTKACKLPLLTSYKKNAKGIAVILLSVMVPFLSLWPSTDQESNFIVISLSACSFQVSDIKNIKPWDSQAASTFNGSILK